MNDTLEQYAQRPLGDNILAQIAQTARDILEAQRDVASRDNELKEAQGRLRALQEDVLPELMTQAGQDSVKTADGLIVTMKVLTRGQPSQENQGEAFAWLEAHGHGGIIKSEVRADLGKATPEQVRAALEALEAAGAHGQAKKTVAWQTLGALVNELLEKGEDVPVKLLGVHHHKIADVKPAK
jgi:hypothetical protein